MWKYVPSGKIWKEGNWMNEWMKEGQYLKNFCYTISTVLCKKITSNISPFLKNLFSSLAKDLKPKIS